MDDVRIYSRALGSNEVQALYADSASIAAAPTNLTADAGNHQVTLSWSPVPSVTGYNLERGSQSGGPYISIASIFSTNYTDNSVTNGVTYYYIVAAENSLGDGIHSTEMSATPSLNSSLKAWFAADAIIGLTDGMIVSNWADFSGNGNNASQSDINQQPLYIANVMNGLPAVRFNAASSNYLAFTRPVQDDFTILCVFRSSQGWGSGNLYYQGAGLVNGEVAGTTDDFGTCLFANGKICAGTGNPDVAVNSSAGFNDGQPHLMTFRRTENTGEMDLYLDGNFMGSQIGNTNSLAAPDQLVLGAQQTLINFFSGDIAELKIFNSTLSDLDRNAEESELECKYGIAGSNVAPTAPTDLAGLPSNRAVTLSWSAISSATYNLSWSANSNGPFTQLVNNLMSNSYSDTNAVIGKTNYYEVAAANSCNVSTNSAPIGIFLPQPLLSLNNFNLNGATLTISWPDWADGWRLYYATNLVTPITWFPVTNAVSASNQQFNVTAPISSGTRFFHLAAP